MNSLLNNDRPPLFCPGCSHEQVVRALDKSLQNLGLPGNKVAIVTDIGCSGLFDIFFNTHALHGLHGRALTYATGLKLACPSLTVVVIMGDGGLGIGGAHVLSSCRRNLDLNLLVLNNFNYGMTGGQCSATTPSRAVTSSGFLAELEPALDICTVAIGAGAGWVERIGAADKALAGRIGQAISHTGFSLVEIRGVCPGRFTKRNKQTPREIEQEIDRMPKAPGLVSANSRPEYGEAYRSRAAETKPAVPFAEIKPRFRAQITDKCGILLLGAAGQRVNTAAELLCLAALSAGLQVSQKSDYPITVLRGHSICEVICSPHPIGYTGIAKPDIVIALGAEGIARRKEVFVKLTAKTLIIAAKSVAVPPSAGMLLEIDFQEQKIPANQWALGCLAVLCNYHPLISTEMLDFAITECFADPQREVAKRLIERCLELDPLKAQPDPR